MKTLTEADRQEIIDSLQAELNKFKAAFIGVAPDWEPLHKLLPPEWWDGWMFMEHNGDLRSYKHGITRNYLHLDADARCYMYRGKRKGWVEIDPTLAVDAAYFGIEKLGETRESKYDEAYRQRKYAALAARGFAVIK